MCPGGYLAKCCKYNHKDEDNSPKIQNDKNHQVSSQKFRQLIFSEFKKTQYGIIIGFKFLKAQTPGREKLFCKNKVYLNIFECFLFKISSTIFCVVSRMFLATGSSKKTIYEIKHYSRILIL